MSECAQAGTQADPFCEIRCAAWAAEDGDRIEVGPGTYTEPIGHDQSTSSFTLVGVAGPGETTIQADLSESGTTIRINDTHAPNMVIEGFAITGATAGGITCANASPTIVGCVITGNTASATSKGGGIDLLQCDATIIDTVISDNTAGSGGGLAVRGPSSATVIRGVIEGNQAVGTTPLGKGGGILVQDIDSSLAVFNSVIRANGASQHGGGIGSPLPQGAESGTYDPEVCPDENLEIVAVNTLFECNSTAGWGGGVLVGDKVAGTFTNCTFVSNGAAQGGAVRAFCSPVFIGNSILWENTATTGFGNEIRHDVSDIALEYNIVGRDPGDIYGTLASDVANIDMDPQFVDRLGPDEECGSGDESLRLTSGSPGIDVGRNAAVPEDSVDLDGDLNTAEPTPLDLDDLPRFIDDSATTDCTQQGAECGDAPIVDMGAYEYQAIAPPEIPATATHQARKHRYLSIKSDTNTRAVGLRVELTSLKRCEDDLERACTENSDCTTGNCVQHQDVGSFWWVQAPQDPVGGCIPGPCGPTDQIARVDSAFYSEVWDLSTLHIGDCEIVPVATYQIRACLTADGSVCSEPLTVGTIEQPEGSPGSRVDFGDVAGQVDAGTGNFTPPDGFATVVDISAYVLTSQNYGTANLPQTHRTWVDLHGLGTGTTVCVISGTPCFDELDCAPGEACTVPANGTPPNSIINVSDLQRIILGVQGSTWMAIPDHLNPADCPPEGTNYREDPTGDPIEFTLVADDDIVAPGEGVIIHVYMDASSSIDIGAYEIRLDVTGGTSGSLELQKASQRLCVGGASDGRPCDDGDDCPDPGACQLPSDFVFGEEAGIKAASPMTNQLSNARGNVGDPVQGQKYLATYRFQPSGGATGVFTFAVVDDYDLSFFNDSDGVLLASQSGATEVVGVGVDCLNDSHCEQLACRTGTCVDNACIYDNAPQGTPCNDGLFCTATDECDGNGACVGSGTPCGMHYPKCCDGESQCICSTCPCSEQ